LLGGLVVVGALLVALVVSSGDDEGDGDTDVAQTAEVTIDGVALPRRSDTGDPAVGRPAPSVTGTSFDGTAVSIEPGRPTIVVFLAHWCPHCQAEVPVLTEHFDEEGLPEGVDVVAVSTSVDAGRPNPPPSSWLEDEGWPTPVLRDSAAAEAAAAFGLSGFPFLVGLDAEGRVVGRVAGEFPTSVFDALVEAVRD
jgi:thiol-disulfide isomerase/thioredoxin